jgi:hypothetical protein
MLNIKNIWSVIFKIEQGRWQSTQYFFVLIFLILALLPLALYLQVVVHTVSLSPDTLTGVGDREVPLFEVFYTSEGYSPNIVEVPLGARVVFKNVSDIPMWTASDPHPVHSDFSTFDAGAHYVKDEVYAFQFNSVGTFGYHNHVKSLHRGIVRVYDVSQPSPDIDKVKAGQRAVRDRFIAMLDQNNPDSIFTVIDAIEGNSALARDCHDMSHDLGHKAYELFGFSTAMTFNNPSHLGHVSADDICAGGYIHGILEEVFLHQPELKNQPEPICVPVPDANRGSCFHGVGHGLMFVNKRDVPASLADCRRLQKNLNMLRCFEGVWMEMFWGATDHAGSNSLGWTLEKPLTPCMSAREDEKPACFLYAHLGYLRTHPRDFTGAVNLCTKSDLIPNDTQFCLKGVGITMMKHFTSSQLEKTESLVQGLGYWEKYAYYQGVIGYARLSGVSDSSLTNVCNQLKADIEVCLTVIKTTPP